MQGIPQRGTVLDGNRQGGKEVDESDVFKDDDEMLQQREKGSGLSWASKFIEGTKGLTELGEM